MTTKAKATSNCCQDFHKFTEGVFITMLLSIGKAALAFLKNEKFLKLLIIFSAMMFVWYVGRIPIEFNDITAWTPTFILVDIGAAITSACSIVFMVLYLLVKNKLKKLGFSGVLEWLKKDC